MRGYALFWKSVCLLILLIFPAVNAGSLQTIPSGGTVFVGEQGLNVTAGLMPGTLVSWYSGSQQAGKVPATVNYTIGDPGNFNVNPEIFRDYLGKWYVGNTTAVAFTVADPTLDLKIWDQQNQTDVSGQTIQPGDYINFRIDSNLDVIPKQRNITDGFLAISVRNSAGNYYSQMKQDSNTTLYLIPLSVNATPFWWVQQTSGPYGWNTGAKLQSGDHFYSDGSYSISVDLTPLNSIRKTYDVVGKTKSVKSITLSSGPSAIETSSTIAPVTAATSETPVPSLTTATGLQVTTGNDQARASSPAAAGPVATVASVPISTTTTPRTTVSPGFETGAILAGLGFAVTILCRRG